MVDPARFLLRLPAVAGLAERLQVARVPHQFCVTLVGDLMVGVRRYGHKVEAQTPLA